MGHCRYLSVLGGVALPTHLLSLPFLLSPRSRPVLTARTPPSSSCAFVEVLGNPHAAWEFLFSSSLHSRASMSTIVASGVDLSLRPKRSYPADCLSPFVFLSSPLWGLLSVALPVYCRPGRPGCRLRSAPPLYPFQASSSLSLGPLSLPTNRWAPGALCLPPTACVGMPGIDARPRCIHNRSVVALRMISRTYSRPGTCEFECDMLGPPRLCVFHLT